MQTTRLRKPFFAVATALLVALGLELLSALSIYSLERVTSLRFQKLATRLEGISQSAKDLLREQGSSLVELDSEIGWIYASNRRGMYSSNELGSRGTRSYDARRPRGVFRVAAFGDSFVHSNENADEDAWSTQIECIAPSVEVLNFGVGGYGTDQALLLYRRKRLDFDIDLVLLGFAEVNLARNVNRFRRFLDSETLALFKPRFRLGSEGDLVLVPNPIRGIPGLTLVAEDPIRSLASAQMDFFFEPLEWRNPLYDRSTSVRLTSTLAARVWRSRLSADRIYRGSALNETAEAFSLFLALVRQFASEVSNARRAFLLVIFPTRESDIWGDHRVYQPIKDRLDDLWVLDLADALQKDPTIAAETMWAPGGHYSPTANMAVARAITEFIEPLSTQ